MKRIFTLLVLATTLAFADAQTPADGFIMSKGELCTAVWYQQEAWNRYWEGTFYRDNPNLGTVRMQSLNAMAAYGLFRSLNVIAVLPPYIQTRASGGSLAGHSGLQDAALWLKYRPLHKKAGAGHLNGFVSAGGSLPVSDYYPDYLPLSIGLGAKTLGAKGILQYFAQNGLYAGIQAGWQWRNNIRLERDFYYTEGTAYYTDNVNMPNVAEGSATIGYYKGTLRTEVVYTAINTLGGGDIRRNDMPFPSYNMDTQRLHWMMQYRFSFLPGLGLTAQAAYTLRGRNMGRTTTLAGGFLYQFNVLNGKPFTPGH
jgi:hypothetical protein